MNERFVVKRIIALVMPLQDDKNETVDSATYYGGSEGENKVEAKNAFFVKDLMKASGFMAYPDAHKKIYQLMLVHDVAKDGNVAFQIEKVFIPGDLI